MIFDRAGAKAAAAGRARVSPGAAGAQPSLAAQIGNLKTQFRAARARRDFERMFAISGELLGLDPNLPEISLGMARTLTELGRTSDASVHWRRLRDDDPNDAEAAYHVARDLVHEGRSVDESVAEAAPGANDLLRRHLIDLVGRPEVADPPDCRHVAICGVSFCGSTLLDRVLGGLPGVRSIGESHWLVKEHDGSQFVPIDLGMPRSGRGPFCSVCGPKCQVLTSEFRIGLIVDVRHWYRRIAAQLGTSILVSADKNVPKLVDHDPLLRLSALIVFKSPEQAWASQLAKMPEGRPPELYQAELVRYMDTWTRSYRTFLDDFNPVYGKIFLKFDDFARSPERLLQAVCDKLALPYDAAVLKETRPGHAIGGNKGAMARLRAADYGVNITPLPDAVITPDQADAIAQNKPLQNCYKALLASYRETLASA